MDALLLLIPLSLAALGVATWLFLRMSSGGQFDEGEGPAYRVLMDDDSAPSTPPEPSSDSSPGPSSGPGPQPPSE